MQREQILLLRFAFVCVQGARPGRGRDEYVRHKFVCAFVRQTFVCALCVPCVCLVCALCVL